MKEFGIGILRDEFHFKGAGLIKVRENRDELEDAVFARGREDSKSLSAIR